MTQAILPAAVTVLVGRETEIADLRERIRSEQAQLITLTGPPGVGKTRLALAVAEALVPDFRDGVVFVSLARIDDAGLLLPAIARSVGLEESSAGGALAVRLRAFLVDRHLLLVLDNFEHVRDAAPVIVDLISAAPRLMVLVASRVALRVSGEQEYPVPPLTVPALEPLPPVPSLARNPAVALFAARVGSVRPDFALDPSNTVVIAEICARLDGLPLAIELAAARTKLLTPRALLTRLSQRLAVLRGGARDLPERQRSLQATLEASYDLLRPAERRIFRQFAVFAGSSGLEAVEAICELDGEGADRLLEALEGLIDHSLVRAEAGEDGEVRLSMLDTIREFALERHEAEDAAAGLPEALRRRHARFYLAMAEQAAQALHGPHSGNWFRRLEAEHGNFGAALAWVIEHGEVEIGLRLAGALGEFWALRGHVTEGRRWLEEVLALPSPAAPERAGALAAAGVLVRFHGELKLGRELLEESLAIWRAVAEPRGIARALTRLGALERHSGEFERARKHLDEALALWRELDDRAGLVQCLASRAGLANAESDHETARELREESLAVCRAAGDADGMAQALIGLGEVARCQGDYTKARECYEESLRMFRELGSRYHVGATLSNLGYVLRRIGAFDSAVASFREALAVYRAMGHQVGLAVAIAGIGGIRLDQGDPENAVRLLSAGIRVIEELGALPARADRMEWDLVAYAAREALGTTAFDACWADGRALDPDRALAAAVGEPERGGSPLYSDAAHEEGGRAVGGERRGHDPGIEAASSDATAAAAAGLTDREVEVLQLLALGLSYAGIAKRLSISPRTVDAHLRSVYAKLDVHSRHEAVRRASLLGLV